MGVAGISDLGHLAIKLAVAKGAEVHAVSTSASKVNDMRRFGTKEVVPVGSLEKRKPYNNSLHYVISIMLIGVLLGGSVSAAAQSDGKKGTMENQMILKIGQKSFTATLADNATATAFKAMLPITLNMADLNENEKVVRLSADLPTDDSKPERIHAGDLMIWTSRSLVLFYKTFPTSYSYTKLGRITDVAGLSAAVGSGKVTVTFELK